MKQLNGQAIAVSRCHNYQLDLIVTLQRIGHRMLMYVNRGYHCQWASASAQCHTDAGDLSFP
jgi:hypothetical protein